MTEKKMSHLGIVNDIIDEIERAEKKHPGWPDDLCRQGMITSEEMGEAVQAILNYVEASERFPGQPNQLMSMTFALLEQKIDKEMVETAAMAIRFLWNWRRNDKRRSREVPSDTLVPHVHRPLV